MDALEGQRIVQTIYLEPYGNKYLFALDKPISFSIYRNKYSRARIYPFKSKIFERIRYTATSKIMSHLPQAMIDRNHYLQLPDNFAPKLRELVENLVGKKAEEERMKTLLRFIQRGNYRVFAGESSGFRKLLSKISSSFTNGETASILPHPLRSC